MSRAFMRREPLPDDVLGLIAKRPHVPASFERVVLPMDKPPGWTSFDVIRWLRRRVRVRKIGHAGTLDPMATGLLLLALPVLVALTAPRSLGRIAGCFRERPWVSGFLGLIVLALIPVLIQLAFGADILWRHRWKVLTAITVTTLYLSYADALAIGSGTWTIDPQQSLQMYLGGVLPVEEFIFFLLTNTLVVFGMTLVLAEESQPRAEALERYALLRPLLRWIRRGRKQHQMSTEHA